MTSYLSTKNISEQEVLKEGELVTIKGKLVIGYSKPSIQYWNDVYTNNTQTDVQK